jgi:polyhydroxyalkanoate synthesis regulator phasin
MFNKKKVTAVVAAVAFSLASASGAIADTGHAMGVPPQVSTVLSDLVTKGTITQAQSDAISAALKAAAPTMPNGMGGKAGKGGFGMNSAAKEAVITSTLGITAAELQAARQAGKSLATLAGAKTDALITALVNYETTQIDAAVTAGKLTAAQATTLKANLKAHITQEVNEVKGMRGMAPKIPSSGTTNGAKSVTKMTIKTVSKTKA